MSINQQLRIPPRFRNGQVAVMPGVGEAIASANKAAHPVATVIACLQLVPVETWPSDLQEELWARFDYVTKDEAFYAPEIWKSKVWANVGDLLKWVSESHPESESKESSYVGDIKELIATGSIDSRSILPLSFEQEHHKGVLRVHLKPLSKDRLQFVTENPDETK